MNGFQRPVSHDGYPRGKVPDGQRQRQEAIAKHAPVVWAPTEQLSRGPVAAENTGECLL